MSSLHLQLLGHALPPIAWPLVWGLAGVLALLTLGAIAAIVTDPRHYNSGRDFAASLGLVPRQDGTGAAIPSSHEPNRAHPLALRP